MRACTVVAAGLAACAVARAGESVVALLAGVAANARFPVPTRADVRLERHRGDQTAAGAAVVIGRGQTLYVETRDGTRALVRPSKIVVRAGARVVRATPGARLGDTDILLEDLVPVTPTLLKVPQVSDEGPTGTVVTGAPAFPSVRALIVLTIDPASHVVTRAKYYEKTISDLAAFRRDDDFVDVAGHQRPTRIAVDRTRDETSTHAELSWRPAPDAPAALFTLAGLRAPSSVMPGGPPAAPRP